MLDMAYTHYRKTRRRAFTLIELIIVIVVLGILSTIAIVGYQTVVNKTTEAKQVSRMTQVLKEAKVLYVQNIYSDPTYTWTQAVATAIDDLPTYTTNALSYGAQAQGASNQNTAANGWTAQIDVLTTDAIYSASPNDIVMYTTPSGTVYVASAIASDKGVFGMVSQTMAPFVWVAGCSGNTCDAATASSGPPAGSSYAAGTTAPSGPTISYSNTGFTNGVSSEVRAATSSGATSFSYTGTLPAGVTFNTTTGAFTGPSSWSSTESYTTAQSRSSGLCVLTNLAAVKCWGNNGSGKVGNGSTTGNVTTPYTTISGDVIQLSATENHACALLSGGVVKCWGWNGYGQLGDGTTTTLATPTAVAGLPSGVAQISAGYDHTCARTSLGAVWCWGANTQGQIGDGTTTTRSSPTQVTGLTSGVTDVSAGQWGTCVVQSGAAKCWGYGAGSANGSGSFSNLLVPTQVTGLTSGVTIVGRHAQYGCAVQSGGVKCWGDNGGVGDGTTAYRTTPVQVTGITSGVTALSVTTSICVVQSGAVKCWGYNNANQMADSTGVFKTSPFQIPGLTSGFASVSSNQTTTTVIDSLGRLWLWTQGDYGQRGDGTSGYGATVPATSPYMFAAPTITPAFPATVAVTATGASGSTTINVTLTSP